MLVKCPECGRPNVSSETNSCPGCGYDVRKYYLQKESQERRERLKKITSSAEYQRLQNRAAQLRKELADLNKQKHEEMIPQKEGVSLGRTACGLISGIVLASAIGSCVGGVLGFFLGFFLIAILSPACVLFLDAFHEKERKKHNSNVIEKYTPLISGKEEELKEIESTMTKMTSMK